ncbi:MAG: AMP-binding protein [Betaproteobacteria bacterium]|nr:AMP-binding protein [Betaproteobacteria bacterium]MBK8105830.1 AMP-binding protein [Betaproteobacteria bacterium]
MEKVWLNQYPEGIAPEIDVHAYASLQEVFERSCERFAGRPAYANMGVSMTYQELEHASRAFGAFLQHKLGMKKGERLAIMLPNLLQYPVALFGALRAGFTVVNTNPQYTARELEHQLKDSGATAIVVLENFAHTLEEVLRKNPELRLRVITTEVGDMFPIVKELLVNAVVRYVKHMVPQWHIPDTVEFNAALREGNHLTLDNVALAPDDIAFLQYTGGTTGVAKGVMLTHANLVANVQQLGAWIARDLVDGEEVAVIPLPLYHVYALTMTLVNMKIGAQVVLITNPRELADFIDTLRRTPFTMMIGVNTLYAALLNHPDFEQVDTGHVKVAAAGGMAVQRVVAQRWKERTGVPLVEGYGLTETAPVVTSNALDIIDWTGTVGLPLPSTEVAAMDDQGRVVPLGEIGEICVRGPQVMKAYWNRPDETAKVFTADGWLRTGDVGSMDERGFVKITDRKKDMINVSGFKVFPNEVEDVVAMHPGVLEVAAVGEPDEMSGELVKIVVVPKDPALAETDLIDHCRKHLTAYKVPKIVEFRSDPLPKTNIGKILRRELRRKI